MKYKLIALTAATLIASNPSLSFASDTISDAIKEGKVGLSFRLRSESVDQEVISASDINADAVTLKTRLNYKTAEYQGFSGFIEFDDISDIDDADDVDKTYISDPEGTEVNQAYLVYSGIPDSKAIYGRQRITLDNHRHIGSVAFRQNEQTYDAFSITNTTLSDTTIFLGHINSVKRIFGEDSLVGEHNVDDYLFNASYKGLPVGSITGYYYDFEYEDDLLADRSSKTAGIRFSGNKKISERLSVDYTAEYASQSDAHNNTADYTAKYYLVEGAINVSGVKITAAQETLGADGANGYFQTNLATLHKFQGWTDKFLNGGRGNIAGGIEDTYLSIGTSISGIKLLAVYHDFQADDSSVAGTSNYGSETGIMAAKSFGDYGLELKYADYNADGFATDTSKLWLTATASF